MTTEADDETSESTCEYTPTLDELTSQGLNKDVAEAILKGDYSELTKAIDKAIIDEVESRIKTNIPKARQTEEFANYLKAFEDMGYKERLKLSKENPRLYKQLVQKSL